MKTIIAGVRNSHDNSSANTKSFAPKVSDFGLMSGTTNMSKNTKMVPSSAKYKPKTLFMDKKLSSFVKKESKMAGMNNQ